MGQSRGAGEIVDSHKLETGIVDRRTQNVASNASEAIDTNFSCHGQAFLPGDTGFFGNIRYKSDSARAAQASKLIRLADALVWLQTNREIVGQFETGQLYLYWRLAIRERISRRSSRSDESLKQPR